MENLEEAVQAVCNAVSALPQDIPVLFLGHSFGTVLAFECIKQLEQQSAEVTKKQVPLLLSIGGIPANVLCASSLYRDLSQPLHTQPPEQVLRALQRASREMYGLLPAYLDDQDESFDLRMVACTVQGKQFCIFVYLYIVLC